MSRVSAWMRAFPAVALLAGSLVGCDSTTDQTLLSVEALGNVVGVLFIDLNGNGQPDAADDGVEGWQVRLEQPGGGLLASEVTDTAGEFAFEGLPVGRVALKVDAARLGDTLQLFGVAFDPVTVALEETTILQPGVTFPKVTVAEARQAALGKPLFTTGVALNAINQNVSVLHIQDIQGGGAAIRVRDLVGKQVAEGDSVRVRGRSTRVAGQPLLETGTVFVLGRSAALIEAVELGTGSAATANGGALDGALVQVRNAEILEVEDLDELGVRLVVDDGSGELEILLRPFLNPNPNNFNPATMTLTRARGLLVATDDAGITRWMLQPRTGADYRVDPKAAPLRR